MDEQPSIWQKEVEHQRVVAELSRELTRLAWAYASAQDKRGYTLQQMCCAILVNLPPISENYQFPATWTRPTNGIAHWQVPGTRYACDIRLLQGR